MMRGTVVGKIDEKNAMVTTEVFDPAKMAALMQASAPQFAELAIKHEAYSLTPAPGA